MSNWNSFIDACKNFYKGDYVVIQWWGNHRCIIKLNHFGYTNDQTCIFADYGLNDDDELLVNHPFGFNDNSIRYATQVEIDILENNYHQAQAKVQMEQEKNIKCNDITKEVKITCGDVEIVINKK